MRRWAAATGLVMGAAAFVLACESGPSDEGLEPTPLPEWREPEADPNEVPRSTGVDAGAASPLPVLAEVDVAAEPEPTYVPLVDRTASLKERYYVGERVRREMRLQRAYRVVVQSGRAASVQGMTEIERAYTVDVTDALGGQIVSATLTVETDRHRLVPSGDEPPRVGPSSALLEGARFDCRLNAEAGFDCEVPLGEGRPVPIEGVVPQRPGAHPGRPATVGDTWEISGVEARNFLGIEGADVIVTFLFGDDDATYREQPCNHITYTFSGTQPLRLSGRTLGANLTGTGELYQCRRQNLILYHRQEREVAASVSGRRAGAPPMERVEHIVFEEETTVEPSEAPSPGGGP